MPNTNTPYLHRITYDITRGPSKPLNLVRIINRKLRPVSPRS